jgi:hypothetical protein
LLPAALTLDQLLLCIVIYTVIALPAVTASLQFRMHASSRRINPLYIPGAASS